MTVRVKEASTGGARSWPLSRRGGGEGEGEEERSCARIEIRKLTRTYRWPRASLVLAIGPQIDEVRVVEDDDGFGC